MATGAQGTRLMICPQDAEPIALGYLSSVGEIRPEVEELDVTTLDSPGGWREYRQGMRSAGEIELEGYHDAGDAGQAALRAALGQDVILAFEVSFPDGMRVRFSGFVKRYSIGAAQVDSALGFGVTIRITGCVHIAGAADTEEV